MSRDPLGEMGGLNLYAFVGNNPANFVDPLGLEGFALDLGSGYGLGDGGDISKLDGGAVGTGVFIGKRPGNTGHAQLGTFAYHSMAEEVPGARLGLGLNATYYKIDSRDFFKGYMDYTMLTIGIVSAVQHSDPCTGETTGWTISLFGKGGGLTWFEKGTTRSWSGALQE